MEHHPTSIAFRISPRLHATGRRPEPHVRTPSASALLVRIVGVAALVAASVAAIADQSTRFVSGQEIIGVHEIPAFIAAHVELTSGLSPESAVPAACLGLSAWDPSIAPQRVADPGSIRTATEASGWSSR